MNLIFSSLKDLEKRVLKSSRIFDYLIIRFYEIKSLNIGCFWVSNPQFSKKKITQNNFLFG